MKKLVALLSAACVASTSLVACTPKPVSAEPVAERFIEGMETRNTEELAQLVDKPEETVSTYDATYGGLQAEGVDVELLGVDQRESQATARYKVTWDLPKERTLEYDTAMTLTKQDKDWTVRWQPSIIHPDLGAHQHLELRAIEAQRASVVSSDGVELMSPGLQYRVVVDTSQVDDVRPLASKVSSALAQAHAEDDSIPEVDPAGLAKDLEGVDGAYSVAVLSDAQIRAARPHLEAVSGLRLNEEPALVTRERGMAPDILARVRSMVSEEIDGNNGWSVSVVNEHGAALSDVELHEPQAAPSVKVSLDYNVQRAAQEAVNLRAESEAMLVAMRPSTGEILAVAQTEAADKKGDIALQGQFPPGSVFKIITAAAGVQDQGLSADSIVPCPGTMNIYGRTVTNYNGFSLGSVPLRQAFAQSCNTTFADISTQLPQGDLKKIGKQFGFGVDYDIPGLTTITGSIPEGDTPLARTESGYGQGEDLASPFGMALVSSTVAAGKTPLPTLVSTHETKASEKVAPPSPAVLDNVRDMMRQVVVGGTAAGMRAGGTIYGKTGEAEINGGSHAWFTGFRDDDIAFATLVVLGGGSDVSVNITDNFLQKLDAYRAEGREAGPAPAAEG
ncbi:penicillin-binding transpeptidase domain-containing protein [Corynebacterium sp.]|uniref:penicillin-binding transpeptidase domain-containing protein n=1 Tax=Corynebacterium sp. TaxID=1720 RepID=UPI0026DB84FF|nr:penicillin-binding transpeptidase domain-containing protein [Corynebacterium sp.]MDO5032486.1 penicillin-binding transpeptidase domain-containing protein [Corynebacterium sp.]